MPGNNTLSILPPELHYLARKKKFDLDPNVLIGDNIEEIKEILLDIKLSDQSRRDSLHKAVGMYGSYNAAGVTPYIKLMGSNDSVNQIILTRIFKKYQWPSSQTFGEHASEAAFLVLIHADLNFQMEHIQLLETAVKQRQASPLSYAIMIDRILKRQGKKQMYGTHGFLEPMSNKIVLLPIESENDVDKRRADLGLPKLEVGKCDILVSN